MNEQCDIVGCKRKATDTYEDMTDGEWVSLCDYHARKMSGQIR